MYQTKNYSEVKIDGLSDDLLANHLELYAGYVRNTDHLLEHLSMEDDEVRYAELKRRLGWEWNGMRLHEYFFENIGASEELSHGALMEKIEKDFGSFSAWEKDFKRLAKIRGIGWVALYYDELEDQLLNIWIEEHDQNHLAGARLLLIIDLFEHAFMPDKIKRPEYAELIIKSIKWSEVEKRFEVI